MHPSINHAKVCHQCGNLNHKTKDCRNKKICLKCGQDDHDSRECKQIPRCINCEGSHASNNELCSKLTEKTYQQNAYILDILTGEGIISDKSEILKVNRFSNIHQTNMNVKSIENIIDKITGDKFNGIFEHLKKHDKEISTTNANVEKLGHDMNMLKDTTNKIQINMGKMEEKVDNIDTKINSINSNMNANHNELVKLFASMKPTSQ